MSLLLGGMLIGLAAIWVVSVLFLIYPPLGSRTASASAHAISGTADQHTDPETSDRMPGRELAGLSRAAVLKTAARYPDPWPALELLSRYAFDTWGVDWLVRIAQSGTTAWTRSRRVAALRLLAASGQDRFLPVLENAAEDQDLAVADAVLGALARHPSRGAAEILVKALRSGRRPESRLARYLDQFSSPIGALLQPLLEDPEARIRYWAATLLSTHASPEEVAPQLVRLTKDRDGLVRKAAISSLADLQVPAAAETATGLLKDPVWYVRAHAARAIGRLGCADRVDEVAKLLADREWWVRVAAKEALEEMGPVVWRQLVPYLDHRDAFARNGAAEILQNNGVLDSLLVLESATASPSPEKIALLRKIAAAGSARLTQAFAERIEEPLRSRLQQLAAELGLDIAGAEA